MAHSTRVPRYAAALTALSLVCITATAAEVQAQVTKDDAKCRAAASKSTAKLSATASKTIASCWKTTFKDGVLAAADCNDPVASDVDIKGKVDKAASKLTTSVGGGKSKCSDTEHTAALAAYTDCPSPGTQGTGLTSFAQVGLCLSEVSTGFAKNMHRSAMDPGPLQIERIAASTAAKQIAKCGNTIQKNFSKLVATVGKAKGKEQAGLDKDGGAYAFDAFGPDSKGKVESTATKLKAAVVKDCGPLSANDLGLLRSCGANAAEIGDCLEEIAVNGATGTTAVSFEMPGICPGVVTAAIRTQLSEDGEVSASKLDAGWLGTGHGIDVIDFSGQIFSSCTDGTCSDCTLSFGCEPDNCRCAEDVSVTCDTPFGVDPDCPGVDKSCQLRFAAPFPVNASGTPVCTFTEIVADLTGSGDYGAGDVSVLIQNRSRAYTGISQTQPCPACEEGVCTGGPRAGLACTPVFSATFPDTSYDCPPDPSANISGAGLQLDWTVSDAPTSITAALPNLLSPLLPPVHCLQCSGDTSVPCSSDAECSAVGAGTCSVNTGTMNSQNACSDLTCTVDEDGEGECLAGPVVKFCDGFRHPNGDGVISCTTNSDCTPLDAGNCTIEANQKCFGETIEVKRTFGSQDTAVYGSTFCVPPTASSAINGAAGLPGPGTARLAWTIDDYCPDGVTHYYLGGGSCD